MSTQARVARALVVLLIAGLVVVIEPVPTSPADAQESLCVGRQQPGQMAAGCTIDWVQGRGGPGPSSGTGNGTGTGTGSGDGPAPPCGWAAVDRGFSLQDWYGTVYDDIWQDIANEFMGDDFLEDRSQQWWWYHCLGIPCPPAFSDEFFGDGGEGQVFDCGGVQSVNFTWVEDGEVPPAQGVAAEVYLLHQAYLEARQLMGLPELAMRPPEGRPTIVQEPSFVEVTNWDDTWNDGEVVASLNRVPPGPVEVTLSWETDLVFVPGEPGSGEIECEPPGTSYDGGPEPAEVAAAEGACAYTYTQHTRETPYSGEVRVDWNFEWSSNTGYGGVFDPVEMATPFNRSVDEVQTVVDEFPELEDVE